MILATISAAVGETFLSYGMKLNGHVDVSERHQWVHLVLSVISNKYISAGVILLCIYFFLYLIALSWADLSFVLPLTAMSYVFAALLAKFYLREDVSFLRWAGTIVIILGVTLVSLDGKKYTADSLARPGTESIPETSGEK